MGAKEKSQTRSQSKSIGLVAIVNAANAVVGVAQAFIVGRLFGTTSGIEIFFAASMIFVSVNKLLQAGQIAEIFTPIYHQVKESDGPESAFELQAVLLNWMLLITFLISLILFFAAPFIIPITVPGFSAERIGTCVAMFQLLVPLIAMQILQFLLANLLINEKHFVARETTRSFAAIVSLLFIVLLAHRFDAWTMIGALWASISISVVVFCVLISRMGYRHRFRLQHDGFKISDVFKKTPTILGYVGLNQLYVLVLTAGLSTLPQGMLAVYNYAMRLYSRVSGILVRPVSTVFFSHFSSAVAEEDAGIQKITVNALRLILLLTTATCVLAITAGLPALRALWLSPVFPEDRIWLTYALFCILCFVPVFSGLALIFRKINMAHQFTHSQYMILMVNQLIAAFLAYWLIPMLGIYGAASALFGNVVLSAIGSGYLLKRTRPERLALYDRNTLIQCITLFVFTVFPVLLFQHSSNFYHWLPDSTIGHLLETAILSSAAIAIMATVAHLIGIGELRSARNLVQRKCKRLLGSQ